MSDPQWHPTACNLCYANCGVLVRLDEELFRGGDGKGVWGSHRTKPAIGTNDVFHNDNSVGEVADAGCQSDFFVRFSTVRTC